MPLKIVIIAVLANSTKSLDQFCFHQPQFYLQKSNLVIQDCFSCLKIIHQASPIQWYSSLSEVQKADFSTAYQLSNH
jgi:hypothetical protein